MNLVGHASCVYVVREWDIWTCVLGTHWNRNEWAAVVVAAAAAAVTNDKNVCPTQTVQRWIDYWDYLWTLCLCLCFSLSLCLSLSWSLSKWHTFWMCYVCLIQSRAITAIQSVLSLDTLAELEYFFYMCLYFKWGKKQNETQFLWLFCVEIAVIVGGEQWARSIVS